MAMLHALFFQIPLRYKKSISILFVFQLFSSLFLLVSPYISKLFIDQAFLGKDIGRFLYLSVVGGVLFVLSTAFTTLARVFERRIGITVQLNLARRLLGKLYALDLEFFQSRSAGESIYRIADTQSVARFLTEDVPGLLVELVKLPVILGVCVWINIPLTVALVVLSPLFVLQSAYVQKKLRPIYEQLWQKNVVVQKELYEAFSRMPLIKALGLQRYQRMRYVRALIENIRWQIRSFRWDIVSSVIASFLSKAVFGLIALYGGWMIIKGRISLGSYTAVMIYLTQVGGIVQSLGHRFEYVSRELVSLGKFSELMQAEPRIIDHPDAGVLDTAAGKIVFKEVTFGYAPANLVLNRMNLVIPAREWVFFVGPSGCGKTTLVNLLLRLYDPLQGSIAIDGMDLRRIRLRSLRQKMSVATQQPFLFDVSIRENIAYGLKGVAQEQVEEASRLACIHDFTAQLPQGYETVIGEDACRLSFGQKQRIAIARALARNPDILILDEATSSVDLATDDTIMCNLKEKRRGLTTIVVTHRIFSLKAADMVYFIGADGVIETGMHAALLEKNPVYRAFFFASKKQRDFTETPPVLPTR